MSEAPPVPVISAHRRRTELGPRRGARSVRDDAPKSRTRPQAHERNFPTAGVQLW
ncbi:hypothetical protein [Saccharopolyspora halophila]|uniref:hypothetical protein n=1 Tax=Saccharopolyspora halophila TaxID=405551 RepID=UPI0031D83948